ncbi:hypothetical protein IFM89_009309, partial [Coptis chinensis]
IFIFDDLHVHLFDINAPVDSSFKESNNFTSGDRPTVVDTGAFNMSIGEALWELVQRARQEATDNQVFFKYNSPLYISEIENGFVNFVSILFYFVGSCLWQLAHQLRDSSGSYMIFGVIQHLLDQEDASLIEVLGVLMIVTNMSFSFTLQFGEIIETIGHEETTVIAEVNYSMIPLQRYFFILKSRRILGEVGFAYARFNPIDQFYCQVIVKTLPNILISLFLM